MYLRPEWHIERCAEKYLYDLRALFNKINMKTWRDETRRWDRKMSREVKEGSVSMPGRSGTERGTNTKKHSGRTWLASLFSPLYFPVFCQIIEFSYWTFCIVLLHNNLNCCNLQIDEVYCSQTITFHPIQHNCDSGQKIKTTAEPITTLGIQAISKQYSERIDRYVPTV